MKKSLLAVGVGVLTLVTLSGCVFQPEPIYFEGKLMDRYKVEEILSDRLEDENGVDFIVKIREEGDE